MTTSNASHLRSLVERADWLDERTAGGAARLRDIKERDALRWALPILGDLLARNADEPRDFERDQRQNAWGWLAHAAVESLARRWPAEASRLIAGVRHDEVRRRVSSTLRARLAEPEPAGRALSRPASPAAPQGSPSDVPAAASVSS